MEALREGDSSNHLEEDFPIESYTETEVFGRCLVSVCFEGPGKSSHHIFSAYWWFFGGWAPQLREVGYLSGGCLLPSLTTRRSNPTWETYEETRVTYHLLNQGMNLYRYPTVTAEDVQGRGCVKFA